MESIYQAALKILGSDESLSGVQGFIERHPGIASPPFGPPPDIAEWWLRYCNAMITRQQRISSDFWRRVHSDAEWIALEESTAEVPPTDSHPYELLHRLGVRAPEIKAGQIRNAWHKDWQRLTSYGSDTLLELTREGSDRSVWRDMETKLAAQIQFHLRGCGVGPKISRLMMIWKPHLGMGLTFRHVIPLDSRWQRVLAARGAVLPHGILNQEIGYRAVEDQVCKAAYDLDIIPFLADGTVFGWIND